MTLLSPIPRRTALLLLFGLLATGGNALADRLHLESGGTIDTTSWWIEGDWLMYESVNGTIGIPRASVLRIESDGEARGEAPATGWNSPPPPAAVPGPRPDIDVERLRKLLEQGQAALIERDFQKASSLFLDVVDAAPTLHAARVGYAVSEIALGRNGLALSVIQDGLTQDPDNPQLLELLGNLRYREERVEEGLEVWRRSFEQEPNDRLREKILKAERELHASRDYDFAASSHFNVRYDGDVDLTLAAAVMEFLEEQFWQLSDLFRHSPPQPITVQLYPRREFREVTRAPEWVGGLYDGKIRVPLGGLNRLDPRARNVLRHELAHAVIHSKTRGNCPRWLHEGLAQIVEEKALLESDLRAAAARLAAGEPAAWEAQGFSYPMALSLVRFLESRQGFDGLVYLLQQLGDGGTTDEALKAVYGQDYAEICADWSRELIAENGG